MKLRIYKAAILRYLTYCSLVWHFCRGSDRRKLERVNERGLRAAFCNWRSSYDELLTRARMTSLYNRRLQDIAILSVSLSSHNLRNSDFFIPRFDTVKYGRHKDRNLATLSAFKTSIAKKVFSSFIAENKC